MRACVPTRPRGPSCSRHSHPASVVTTGRAGKRQPQPPVEVLTCRESAVEVGATPERHRGPPKIWSARLQDCLSERRPRRRSINRRRRAPTLPHNTPRRHRALRGAVRDRDAPAPRDRRHRGTLRTPRSPFASRVPGGGDPQVGVVSNQTKPPSVEGKQCRRSRAVVHNDALEGWLGLGRDRTQRLRQILRAVTRRNDHRHLGDGSCQADGDRLQLSPHTRNVASAITITVGPPATGLNSERSTPLGPPSPTPCVSRRHDHRPAERHSPELLAHGIHGSSAPPGRFHIRT